MLGIYVKGKDGIEYSVMKIDYEENYTKVAIQNQSNGVVSHLEFNEILTIPQIVEELMK